MDRAADRRMDRAPPGAALRLAGDHGGYSARHLYRAAWPLRNLHDSAGVVLVRRGLSRVATGPPDPLFAYCLIRVSGRRSTTRTIPGSAIVHDSGSSQPE